jgi:hypothetical protein
VHDIVAMTSVAVSALDQTDADAMRPRNARISDGPPVTPSAVPSAPMRMGAVLSPVPLKTEPPVNGTLAFRTPSMNNVQEVPSYAAAT